MSRFYATIKGEKGPATRAGRRRLGGHIRGWHTGIRVEARIGPTGTDEFDVFITGGTTESSRDKLIGTLVAPETFVPKTPGSITALRNLVKSVPKKKV